MPTVRKRSIDSNEVRISFTGKKDRNGDDYYVGASALPVNIALKDVVLLFFPFEESDSEFGGELVIKQRLRMRSNGKTPREPATNKESGA